MGKHGGLVQLRRVQWTFRRIAIIRHLFAIHSPAPLQAGIRLQQTSRDRFQFEIGVCAGFGEFDSSLPAIECSTLRPLLAGECVRSDKSRRHPPCRQSRASQIHRDALGDSVLLQHSKLSQSEVCNIGQRAFRLHLTLVLVRGKIVGVLGATQCEAVIEMEDSRCRIVAIETDELRGRSPVNGMVIEMDDLRCKGLSNQVVLEIEDPRCGGIAIQMEDPRCNNLRLSW